MPPFDANFAPRLPASLDSPIADLAALAWQMPLDMQGKRAEPSELFFSDIFGKSDAVSDTSIKDFKDIFKNAPSVDFSTAEINKLAGAQPDFFIDETGKLIKNPNGNWKPGDKLNVEVQSNGSELVNRLQGSVIQSILDIFQGKHPGVFPRAWQEVVESLRKSLDGIEANSSGAQDAVAAGFSAPLASTSSNDGNGGSTYSSRGTEEMRSSGSESIRPESRLAPPVAVAGKVFPVDGYNQAALGLHHGSSDGAADIFAPDGTPVRALVGGEVISVGSGGLGGNTITIRQADGKVAYYAHMQAQAATKDGTPIKAGDRIGTGDMVGRVGQTGNAAGKGSHLHLGVGDDIQGGSGAEGGAGTNFNLTGTLNGILEMS